MQKLPNQNDDLLFPPREALRTHMLPVDEIHTVYCEESGNPEGLPVVFLHGGPGAGASPDHRRLFDPEFYRVIIFDQRGAGRSLPAAECRNNSPQALIADMEKIREYFNIDRWLVFGGSWGSTLAIAYGEAHPERCIGFVLRGLFLMRPSELDWFIRGVRRFLPESWDRFASYIPEEERDDLLGAYYRRLRDPDSRVHLPAARLYSQTEMAMSYLRAADNSVADITPQAEQDQIALNLARIETHYFTHFTQSFGGHLLQHLHRIAHLPAILVQGRYDLCCPPETAYDIAKAWPRAELVMVPDAGHASSEPGTRRELMAALEKAKQWLV